MAKTTRKPEKMNNAAKAAKIKTAKKAKKRQHRLLFSRLRNKVQPARACSSVINQVQGDLSEKYALCGKENEFSLGLYTGLTLCICVRLCTGMLSVNNAMQVRDFMTIETLKPHVDFFNEKSSVKHAHGHPKYGAYSIDVMNRFLNRYDLFFSMIFLCKCCFLI